jgi:uncharacterized protein YqjF (DUF2071 family)
MPGLERRAHPETRDQSHPFLTAHWRNLVMLHWEVDPKLLIDRVPVGTIVDLWQGKTYVGLVGFQFLDTKVLGTPVPFHQDFEEVNLRFYVRRVVGDEVRSGVVFICECVPRQLVGGMARLLYREPYMVTPMKSAVRADPAPDVQYGWEVRNRWHTISARAAGTGNPPKPRTLEEFLIMRHWGYNGRPRMDTLEYQVDHPRWTIWHAEDVRLDADLTVLCGAELARQLTTPASALIADGSPVTIHWRQRIA